MEQIKIRKEKLSIYLARNVNRKDEELIKIENAKKGIEIYIDESESSFLYAKNSFKKTPSWTKMFTLTEGVESEYFGESSNVGAVFIMRVFGSAFILSFGTGFHLIKDDEIERDFGLRVTLNSVDPDKLRSLDKASYDHNPLNSRTQSTRDVDVFNLHLDSESEMLYAVTGASLVKEFGNQVTGRDALTIAVETTLNEIPGILHEAIFRYRMKLPDKFSWVDNINRVRDLDEIEILDLELDDYLSSNNYSNFWLGEPEIVDWEDQIGYSFDMYPRTPRHVILTLDDYVQHINNEPMCVTNLKNDVVHINNSEFSSIKSWSVYRCLYAEIDFGNDHYILRNGVWYKINQDFLTEVDSYLVDLENYGFKFPVYEYEREEFYNEYVCKNNTDFSLMDKKNIKIGGAYDKLEHCDLIRNGSDFIHVKYYRSSSTLSHLFFQGMVGAEAFIKDKSYREKLNPKLPKSIRLKDAGLRPNPKKYTIVYAIATVKNIPEELPFFSKVTLKNTLKTLKALDYNVAIAKIDVSPFILKIKKCKPKKI
ncbi:TIGR04141 family sporadically distributed protein [Edaphovirga cremea]|uniref:TIGR04141 family sporadically distributed protein n=1 Tax=Edaphovirga cremea TaxID=2267246 RepID=UPI000DEEC85C|nr:TIGR04141 family sporadically distributed protein [Edaphovirga cremea]